MNRTPLIAANWKMNLTHTEGAALARAVADATASFADREVVLCPPFTALPAVAAVLLPGAASGPARHYGTLETAARGVSEAEAAAEAGAGSAPLRLGAQDAHWAEAGAYTGAVSVGMVRALGCHYVIVGHSERRSIFGEDDAVLTDKVRAVLDGGLVPIFCVGETAEQRRQGETEQVISRQLEALLTVAADRPAEVLTRLVVAYEPVWAIGSGQAAGPQEADAVARYIRQTLADKLGAEAARQIRILYGGSVGPDNAGQFFAQGDIDGALVGGAGLKAQSFAAIVAAAPGAGDNS